MIVLSATKAKQRFAALLDAAQRGPVRIQRHERDIAVLISPEEYEQLRQQHWAGFNRLAERASVEAQAHGLTEETLKAILAE